MKKGLNIFIALLCAIALLSCKKNDDNTETPLSFTTTVEEVRGGSNNPNEKQTKGAEITSATLQNFGAMAYKTGQNVYTEETYLPDFMFNQKVTKEITGWEYSPKKHWPNEKEFKISFFAYAPHSDKNNPTNGIVVYDHTTIGTPYLIYTVPIDVADQPDLIVAIPEKDKQIIDNRIRFEFKHALAYIGFTLKGDNNEQVKSIGLRGFANSAQLSIDGKRIEWSNLTTTNTTQIYNAGLNYDAGQEYVTATPEGIPTATLMKTDGYIMVIPQILTSDTKLVVTLANSTVREVSINLITPKSEWEANTPYTYTIEL